MSVFRSHHKVVSNAQRESGDFVGSVGMPTDNLCPTVCGISAEHFDGVPSETGCSDFVASDPGQLNTAI